jgi:hypothetical protein
MDDLLTNLLTDSVTEKVTEVVVEQATPVDNSLWGVVDIVLETPGLAEGLATALGGPAALVVGIKMFRSWRKKQKDQNA